MVTTLKNTSSTRKALEIADDELADVVGKHYKIFKELYPDREFTLSDLADKTEKDRGNLSKLVTKLGKKGIVETKEVERERGRPLRYIRLSSKVVPIISSFIDAVKPKHEPKYEPLTIDLCLDVMEDEDVDKETRKIYAYSLHSRFTAVPEKILREHERLRGTLEEVVRKPATDEEIEERKRSMISVTMPRLIRDEWARSWVMDCVYPNALKILEDETKPEDIVTWAISILEDIGMHGPDPTVREEIRRKFKEVYFNAALKPNSKVAEKLSGSILRMFCQEPKKARELTNHLRKRVKSPRDLEKEKATQLLKKIVGYLSY